MRHEIQLWMTDNHTVRVSVEADTVDQAMCTIGNLMHDKPVYMFYRPARFYGACKERYSFPVDMSRVLSAQYLVPDAMA